MLQTGQIEIVIREAKPRVLLHLMATACPDLAETPDFDAIDDAIVGIVSASSKTDDYASVASGSATFPSIP